MQTIMLWTSGVFSTTTSSVSPIGMPSSATAPVPFSRSRALYSGSDHALATTCAPSAGPRESMNSSWARTSSAVTTPFSTSRSRIARAISS